MVAVGGGGGGGGDGNGIINKCIDKEIQALLHFKASIEDPYDFFFAWSDEEDDCCNWSGVKCNDQTGHVTELFVFNNTLGGKISSSLLNLTYLNHLDLSGNSFNGTIPTFIGSMNRLRHLDLGSNNFSGTIPTFIGSMSRLRHLDLSSNKFSGTIPTFIGSMTRLRYLDLRSNNFRGTILTSIGYLTKLRYLDLSLNSFHGIIPSEFGNLTNLENLSLGTLGRCRVDNIDWLSSLTHLQSLILDEISLAKENHWVNLILSLQKLEHLSLRKCDLSLVMYPYSPLFLNNTSSSSTFIDYLDLSSNYLNSSMYSWLFPLTSNKLEYLDLGSNMLDGIPKYIGNLCSLSYLNLFNNSAVVKFPDFLYNLSGGCTLPTLRWLDVSNSQFIGSLSDEIQQCSSLVELDLSDNLFNETISVKVWELHELVYLYASSNSFRGVISKNIGKSKLSNIQEIDLSSSTLGPRFPKWIQNLKNLNYLDIANTRISDTIPATFWNTWSSSLRYLNLSSNNISGNGLDLLSNFLPEFSVIDLSTNNFSGPIQNVPPSLVSLNLSRNKFYGGLSFLCQIVDVLLSFLDLSYNSFTGPLPDCLWHFNELKVLNLGYNNLSGRLPTSLGYLFQLEVLYLYNNDFYGEFPLSLKNCTKLKLLGLGANGFYGNVPVWIGENLSELYAFSLRTNKFFGTIPLELCQLVNLQILDLSMNDLYGTIPTCLNNLTLMVQKGFSPEQNVHSYSMEERKLLRFDALYFDRSDIVWRGNEIEFTTNLKLLKMIDLSSNNLGGHIPNELTALHELVQLNLSKNSLHGEIPQNIGQMKDLEILDLSRNNFSGELPSSMSEMTSLDYLDVSYNNLSGRIPSSTQLQSFEPLRYAGNTRLCGLPVTKSCPGHKELELPRVIGKIKGNGEGTDDLQKWFYIGGATGFAIGFWIACSALLLNHHGRHAFFRFLDSSKDWIYVKVMVFISKWQRFAHTS